MSHVRSPTRRFTTHLRRALIRGSLRRQILLAVVVVNIVLIAVILALFFYYDHERGQELNQLAKQAHEEKLDKFRTVYRGLLKRVLPPAVSIPALIRWRGWEDMRYVKILKKDPIQVYINPKGARMRPDDIDIQQVDRDLRRTASENIEISEAQGGTCIPLEFEEDKPWGAIFLLPRDDPPPDIPELPISGIISVLAAGTLLLILVTFILLNRLVLTPLEGLMWDARRLARGDYGTETLQMRDRRDEVGRLSQAISFLRQELAAYKDDMTGRVDRALARAKASERRLAVAQRLAATGKLAAGIAHEINNPLAGMLNMIRRLREGTLTPEKRTQYLELIEDSLNRIETTLGHLIRSSPARGIEVKPLVLGEVVESALALVRHRGIRSRVEMALHFPDKPLRILSDQGALQQIFLNLFLNAMDAMPGGGQLTIRGQELEGESLEVRVEDTGHGMTPEQLDQAFDLFYTTKGVGEGSGLGLSIVHNLVQDLGGSIRVESASGHGSRFILTFPTEVDREKGELQSSGPGR